MQKFISCRECAPSEFLEKLGGYETLAGFPLLD
jgi:hypothetical protein